MVKRSDAEKDNSINSINEQSVNNEQAVNIPSLLSKQSVVHMAVNMTRQNSQYVRCVLLDERAC
jgi:hypothetical protein